MARKTIQTFSYSGVFESAAYAAPPEWLKAEKAWIRTKILQRDSRVGYTDLASFVPVEWTGKYWLLKDNYVVSDGDIRYKQQEIYKDVAEWKAEVIAQSYSTELTTPDADVNELPDESLVSLLFFGELIADVIESLPIPGISDVISWVAQQLAAVSSDDLDYFPSPDRPDTVALYHIPGFADIEVEFLWVGFSPLAITGGVLEIPIDDLVEPPPLPQGDDPFTQSPTSNFDDVARGLGYILPEDCQVPPAAIWELRFNWRQSRGGAFDPPGGDPDPNDSGYMILRYLATENIDTMASTQGNLVGNFNGENHYFWNVSINGQPLNTANIIESMIYSDEDTRNLDPNNYVAGQVGIDGAYVFLDVVSFVKQ